MPVLLGLWLLFWAGSQVLNATNRYLLYFVLFLAGYFLFAHDEVTQRLQRFHLPLLGASGALLVWVLARWFGKSFADAAFVEDPVTTLFGWCMTLAAVGCARAWGDRENRLTRYISARGFALYQFHYLVLTGCMSSFPAYRCWETCLRCAGKEKEGGSGLPAPPAQHHGRKPPSGKTKTRPPQDPCFLRRPCSVVMQGLLAAEGSGQVLICPAFSGHIPHPGPYFEDAVVLRGTAQHHILRKGMAGRGPAGAAVEAG